MQVLPQLQFLDLPQVVVPVLQVAGAGGVHTVRGGPEQDRLRDIGDGRQHIAGHVDDILEAGQLEGLENVVLALGVNDDAVQEVPGHVDCPQPPQHNVIAALSRQHICEALHLVDALHGPLQQFAAVGVFRHGFLERPFQTDVLRQAPIPVLRLHGRFREDAVLEDQAAAFMHHKRSILTVNVEELGLSEFRPGLLNPLHLPIVVHGVVVRLHHGALEKDDLINALDVVPVHRLLQPPAIVNQHDGQGAAEQPRPLDRLRRCGFPVQIFQGVRYQRHNIVITQIEVKIAGGRFLRRDVNDLGEQAVGLIVRSEINVRDRGLRHELIRLAAVLFGSHAVQHIHVTVQAGKPALRLVLALIHSYHRLMLSVSSHQRYSSPQSRQSRWRRRPPCP